MNFLKYTSWGKDWKCLRISKKKKVSEEKRKNAISLCGIINNTSRDRSCTCLVHSFCPFRQILFEELSVEEMFVRVSLQGIVLRGAICRGTVLRGNIFGELSVGKKFVGGLSYIWEGVPSTQTPTSSTPPRPTTKACSSTRSIEEDQLSDFFGSDKVTFTSLKDDGGGDDVGIWVNGTPGLIENIHMYVSFLQSSAF